MTRALVVVAMLAALAPNALAKRACFSGPMRPQVIAMPRAKIAGSGGVIVASGSKLPDWRFRDLNRIARPHIVPIAPGLAIYHPPPLAGIEVVLENETHGVIARTERALKIEPTVAAPHVRSIVSGGAAINQRGVRVDVDDSIPYHAVIAVVSRVSKDALEPLTWVRVRAGTAGSIEVWHPPRACEETIKGAIEPKAGDTLVVQWVDDAGRLSEPSPAVPLTVADR